MPKFHSDVEEHYISIDYFTHGRILLVVYTASQRVSGTGNRA